MTITLNTGITKENAGKIIDGLINQANQINGNWDNDKTIFNWDKKLQEELKKLFENYIEIAGKLNLKGRYDNLLIFELTKMVTPEKYEDKRRERNENNKMIFLQQLSVLLNIKEKLEINQPKSTGDNGEKKRSIKHVHIINLYLNDIGDFWRDPKNKYLYKMGLRNDRYKIIYYLATNNGYQLTSKISSAIENKSERSIRTEIGKIRNKITNYLKIDGKKTLEGRKGSGYRIGLEYKINIKKE